MYTLSSGYGANIGTNNIIQSSPANGSTLSLILGLAVGLGGGLILVVIITFIMRRIRSRRSMPVSVLTPTNNIGYSPAN